MTAFDEGAFRGCVSFTDFDLPENLVSIGSYTFQDCTGLTKLNVPATTTSIGNYAFSGCTGIKEVTFADGEETLALGYGASKGKSYGLFNDCPLEELYLGRTVSYEENTKGNYGYSPFYKQEALSTVTVGPKVKALPYCIFFGTGIQELYVPSSVRNLHSSFANSCPNLKSVIILGGTPPSVDTYNTLLSGSAENSKFYVFFPEKYKSTKPWNSYADKIEACCEIYSNLTYGGDNHLIAYKTEFPIVLKNMETDAVDAGTYQKPIDVTYSTNGYSLKDVLNFEYTIKKAPLTITAKSSTRRYGEENPEFKFDYNGFVNGEDEKVLTKDPTATTKATVGSPAGEYDITVSGAEAKNYAIEYDKGTLTVTKAPLTVSVGDYTKKQGEALPAFTITYDGFKNDETEKVLKTKPTAMTDATAISEPGEYDIVVSGGEADNYELAYEKGKLTVVMADAILITAKSYTREYGEANPAFEYTVGGATLDGEPEIVCEATADSPAGEYPIVIKKGSVTNFNDTYVNGTLTITKAPLTVSVGDYTKKQGEAVPEFTIIYKGFKNNETSEVLKTKPTATTNATESSEPGEYDIMVNGGEADNYELAYEKGKLTVVMADAILITAKSYTREYGEANPAFEYTVGGAALDGEPEIVCEATADSPTGEYPIVIKKGSVTNFNDTYVNGTLTITKAPLTVSVGEYTKKQGEAVPEFTITYSGFKNNETEEVLKSTPTAMTAATEASEPGKYDIVIIGGEADNYELLYSNGTLTVSEADAIVITAKSYTRVYGDENPTYEFISEGASLEGTPEISCEATAASPVGTYPIVIKKGGVTNYNDSYVNGTLTIVPDTLIVAVVDTIREQGQENPIFEIVYEGWRNNETEDVLTSKPVATTSATSESAEGQYEITVSGGEAQNYVFRYINGVLTVIPPSGITAITSGRPFDVYTVSGRKVRHQVTSLKGLAPGVYIVEGRKVTVRQQR